MTSHHREESPEKRYVRLHRAIERGHATDATWEELSDVCYRLGYFAEAVRSARQILAESERQRVEVRLAKLGLSLESHESETSGETENRADPAVPVGWKRGASLRDVNIHEEVVDSATYLFLDHMPFTVMSVALMFPMVVGLGGMFTTGTDFWVFPAIALIPLLCIAVVIGALCQQILLDSARGFLDPPNVAELPKHARRALLFLRDCAVAGVLLLVPGLLAYRYLGSIGIPILIVSAVLFPTAVALCQTRKDLRGLHPRVVFPAAFTLGIPGLLAVAVVWLTFSPALSALWLSDGSVFFLRMSIVGPLAIVPLFISARLMGRLFYFNREHMKDLIWTSQPVLYEDESNVEVYDPRAVQRAAKITTRGPGPKNQGQPRRRPVPSEQQRTRRRRTGQPAPTVHPETVSERSSNAPPAQPKHEPKTTVTLDDAPSITGLEGFTVLTGDERVAAGAAAQRPQS